MSVCDCLKASGTKSDLKYLTRKKVSWRKNKNVKNQSCVDVINLL